MLKVLRELKVVFKVQLVQRAVKELKELRVLKEEYKELQVQLVLKVL